VIEPERCLILSTGRCGSTLLSNLIAAEPYTLSIQESLVNKNVNLWKSDNKITGSEYWNILSVPSLGWAAIVRIGAIAREVRYPAAGRWAKNLAALPPIASVTLSAISGDPDSLFDLLATRVPDFPAQTLAQHHLMFLDLLASLQQRCRWVERSGGSSILADPMLERIPFDKVIYLTRGLSDTASSMSGHTAFRFGAIRLELLFRCGFDPYGDFALPRVGVSDRQVPAELQCLLPDQITAETLKERGGRVEQHKLVWLAMVQAAEAALAEHPPRQLLRMRYEDLVAAPGEQLTRLAEFLGFADPAGWAAAAAGQVSRARRPGQPASGAARAAQAPELAVRAPAGHGG
jgi:putative sulfotransferase